MMNPQFSIYHDPGFDLLLPFDIAVVIPTQLQDCLGAAVRSIFLQDFNGRVHILLGVHDPLETDFNIESLLPERPAHMAISLFSTGYVTQRSQGKSKDGQGGWALRSSLSFLANARYVTYLDEDNWYATNHLSNLLEAIQGKIWAFSNRWFVDKATKEVICQDKWESVGPNKGVFAKTHGGFIDSNCLMIDTLACKSHLGAWHYPHFLMRDRLEAEHCFFAKIKDFTPFGQTHIPTVSFTVPDTDPHKESRLEFIERNAIKTGASAHPDWFSQPTHAPVRKAVTQKSGQLLMSGQTKDPFEISIVIPSLGHKSLNETLQSLYQQDFTGRVQILVGIDKMKGDPLVLKELARNIPAHMTLMILDPSYSTSQRHGGLFDAYDGGAMRTILSYLANAPYVAYLDDDNTVKPNHLSTLYEAIQDHDYAYSLREFIHPDGETLISVDYWESIGPKKGFYVQKFNGFIDPNCLMLNIARCLHILPFWSQPLLNDPEKMSADRVIFHFLTYCAVGKCTDQATSNYVLNTEDPMHALRSMYLGHRWLNANFASFKKKLLNRKRSLLKERHEFYG
jgi:hypothetical protein